MIAVPIAAKNMQQALVLIDEANKDADVIELRLDYFSALSEADLKRLLGACKRPVICTCRRKEEGGLFNDSENKRISVLKRAMKLGCDYVDVEFETKKELRDEILLHKKLYPAKIILSKHYFGITPEYAELEKVFKKMSKQKHDILKIVTKANSNDDNKIIFSLLKHAKGKGERLISFCMGNIGRDSRILCLPLGSYLTFASLSAGKESAEGQIPIAEMKKIYSGLRVMF
ncbi:MAG: type I 3-dehydroquinate dehydratase [archaeon]|nr:type I 3-dehydroquinate dehydratase [archaeon]